MVALSDLVSFHHACNILGLPETDALPSSDPRFPGFYNNYRARNLPGHALPVCNESRYDIQRIW
jgi:hypothetical protein